MQENAMGGTLRRWRKWRGLSQAELAEKVGISTMSVRRYEKGERIIPDEVLERVLKVLDITPESTRMYWEAESQVFWEKYEKEKEEEETRFRHKVIKEMRGDIKSFVDSENGMQIILNYLDLNEEGQLEAVKRIYELTLIPQYQLVDEDTRLQEGRIDSIDNK